MSIKNDAISYVNPAGRRAPSAQELKRRIQTAERKTIPFRLVHTGDIEVYVQRPSLPFLMQMGMVPDAFRKIADLKIKEFGLEKVAKGGVSFGDAELRALVAEHGAGILTFETDLVNATVIAGFVVPPVTMDKAAAEQPDSPYLWINDIAWEDRQAFFDWCNAELEAEVDAVKSDAGSASLRDLSGVVPASDGVRHDADRFAGVDVDAGSGGVHRGNDKPGRNDDDLDPHRTTVDADERLLMGARSDEV